ncbi:hypothetical protein NDU88_006076 [Pleurodeles waltl]|uniref:Uncharacterized protein n=1 Tax=Pleurodeles waltl TaxID=8319 RepID=A0AAV7X1G7_PLEWA|nr:hypothetical protein NDU88_006076 [Pleurodeles waltl]
MVCGPRGYCVGMRGSWEDDGMLECGEMTGRTAVGSGSQHDLEVALNPGEINTGGMVCYVWEMVCGPRGYCVGMRGSWEDDGMLECGEMTGRTAVGSGSQLDLEVALNPGEINT